MGEQVQVVIIGAGAAGLAAGCRLLEKGFKNFVILEASDRIGGRVYSIPFNNGTMDLGAEWVHGEKGNVVFEMASKYSLLYKPDSPFEPSITYWSNGKAMAKEVTEKLMEIFDSIIDDHPEEIKSYNGSLGGYFVEKFWPLVYPLIEQGQITRSEAEDSLRWLEFIENSIDASPSWFKTAANEATEYVKLPGSVLNTWKSGGYQSALDLISKKFPNPKENLNVNDKVRLKHEVTKIDWSGPRVQITCSDGSRFDAERVVTTVSLNVLKANALKIYQPALPEKHQKAIKGLGMATVDKIFIEFPYRWWAAGSGGVNLIWRSQDLTDVPKDKAWTTGIMGFYGSDNHPTVICGWMVGELAEVMEGLSDTEVLSGCMAVLRRFVGNTQEIPEPVRLKRSQWFSNPFVRGSYSCRMVESNELNVWPHDLAEPVNNSQGKPVLLFAGEATSEHYFSTVHGAIETGWREADRILSFQERDMECTVAIIGAGIAGLAAAKALTTAGVNVKVLEAQDSPGGRIHSLATENGVLELGAQWLHGEDTPLYHLAKSYDLLSNVSSEEGQGQYLQFSGKIVDKKLISQAEKIVNETLKTCEDYANSKNYPTSIGNELEEKFNARFEHQDQTVKAGLLNWHKRFQIIDNSCDDLKRLSARAWGLYEDCGKTHCINFRNGFSALIEKLIAELPEKTVHCKTPVRRIEWAPVIHASAKTPRVKIICENVNVRANHVIVTCSLGYLKDNKIDLFRPPLPEPLSRAIELLGFGTIGKIFLVYPEAWWKNDDQGFQFVWSKDAKLSTVVPWSEGVTGFDVVKGKPILQGWVGGPSATIVESLSDEKLMEQSTILLRWFLNKPDIPMPQKTFRSNWNQNEYIRGSYSHVTTACDAEGITCGDLAQPVFSKIRSGGLDESPTILLAGEACHVSHYSTVHGAYESGQQQAETIIKFIRQNTLAKL